MNENELAVLSIKTKIASLIEEDNFEQLNEITQELNQVPEQYQIDIITLFLSLFVTLDSYEYQKDHNFYDEIIVLKNFINNTEYLKNNIEIISKSEILYVKIQTMLKKEQALDFLQSYEILHINNFEYYSFLIETFLNFHLLKRINEIHQIIDEVKKNG